MADAPVPNSWGRLLTSILLREASREALLPLLFTITEIKVQREWEIFLAALSLLWGGGRHH